MPKQSHLLHLHLSKKKRITSLDRVALVGSFVSPVTGLPQAIDVFHGNAAGVSLVSWSGFVVFSLLFLLYGLVHKVKPMIVSNFLWLGVELSVITGLLLHN
ncbi:hypothetical protein HYS42_00975 [Candidatus Saccharibacteria bacterium]|nr:hypothetical protein [Candidatus Saccharibacteria bacterium]